MSENQPKSPENVDTDDQAEVVISYFKSNFFRVVHADGAWGGLSPQGDIHVSFYNERAAIPDTSKLVFSQKTGQLVKPEEFEASSKFVREIEVDVVVDLGTAVKLRTWLDEKITALQLLIEQAQEEK